MPSKVWTGELDATGGYLVVKENGEVLCYHIYNRNEFEDYLFKNTKLETASSTRHVFGKVYEENGQLYFKLNLQIRFK
jgi:type II restriction enzyme